MHVFSSERPILLKTVFLRWFQTKVFNFFSLCISSWRISTRCVLIVFHHLVSATSPRPILLTPLPNHVHLLIALKDYITALKYLAFYSGDVYWKGQDKRCSHSSVPEGLARISLSMPARRLAHCGNDNGEHWLLHKARRTLACHGFSVNRRACLPTLDSFTWNYCSYNFAVTRARKHHCCRGMKPGSL